MILEEARLSVPELIVGDLRSEAGLRGEVHGPATVGEGRRGESWSPGASHGPAVTPDVGEGGEEGVDGREVVPLLQAAGGSGVARG